MLGYSSNSAIVNWNKAHAIPDSKLKEIYYRFDTDESYIVKGEIDPFSTCTHGNYSKSGDVSVNIIQVSKLDLKASAGGGNNIDDIEALSCGTLSIDKSFIKGDVINLKAIQVDGYSMVPMLLPDSWVLFSLNEVFVGDGLYILNWRNVLMVKLLQVNPENGRLRIISANRDYESWEIDPDDQSVFHIIGKVQRVIM